MNRTTAVLAAALLATGCGGYSEGSRFNLGGPGGGGFREEFARADPSKVIAAELAFARAAQEKGQWTAFAEFATDDAVMFVPQPVNAKEWLRTQSNPAQAVRWQPHQVWSSCDGTLAVTKGAWQRPNGTVGYFTTVWERQGNGEYKWVMDQGDGLEQPLTAPEMVGAEVADCTEVDTLVEYVPPDLVADGEFAANGLSKDGTLGWGVFVDSNGSRLVRAHLWKKGNMIEVLRSAVAAE